MFDRIISYGIYGIILFIPLVITPWNTDVTIIKDTIFDLIIYTLLLIWLCNIITTKTLKIRLTPLHIPVLIFWITGVISTVFSSYRFVSIGELSRLTCYVLMFFLVTNFINSNYIKKYLKLIILTALISTSYGIIQYYFPWIDVFSYHSSYQHSFKLWNNSPFTSTFGNPGLFAGYLCTVIPVVISLFIINFIKKYKIFLGITILLMLWCIIISLSRSTWMAISISFMIMIILFIMTDIISITRHRTKILSYIAGVTICFIILAFSTYQLIPHIMDKLISDTALTRLAIWKGVLGIFQEYPVIGGGIGCFHLIFPEHCPVEGRITAVPKHLFHAHNEFLEILAEQGILGLLAFISIIIIFLKYNLKFIIQSNDKSEICLQIGFTTSIIACLVNNLTDITLQHTSQSVIFWLILAMGISSVCKERYIIYPVVIKNFWRYTLTGIFCILYIVIVCVYIRIYISDIYLKKGMDMLGMQQKEAGILNIKRCLKYNPYSLQAYYALAVGYMNIGDMKNATDTWYRLLALVDGYPKAYYYLGNIYQMQGKYKDAIESYKKEIAFNRYVVPEAYNNLGHVYMKVGKIDNAIQEYSMAIRLYPKAEIFYCNLAYAYIQRGDIDAAEGVLIEALKINPDNKKVMYQLGEIYRNRGRYKEAEQMYKKIISEFGTSSDDANDKIVARAKQKLELLKLKTSNL